MSNWLDKKVNLTYRELYMVMSECIDGDIDNFSVDDNEKCFQTLLNVYKNEYGETPYNYNIEI